EASRVGPVELHHLGPALIQHALQGRGQAMVKVEPLGVCRHGNQQEEKRYQFPHTQKIARGHAIAHVFARCLENVTNTNSGFAFQIARANRRTKGDPSEPRRRGGKDGFSFKRHIPMISQASKN
ncbi:MAG: hypothetical protein ACKOVA_12045, partial [Novosphingobium sp.]